MTKIKICGIKSIEDAKHCLDSGIDMLGFVVDVPPDLPIKISAETAKQVISKLPNNVEKVLITDCANPEKTAELCKQIGATAIQIVARSKIKPEEMKNFRKIFGNIKIMKSVPVLDESSIQNALSYSSVADILLMENRGVSEQKPDWSLCAKLVQLSKKPVMLAGGLTPENVKTAISIVKPWAVDVMSGVESAGKKSPEKIRAFVESVKSVK